MVVSSFTLHLMVVASVATTNNGMHTSISLHSMYGTSTVTDLAVTVRLPPSTLGSCNVTKGQNQKKWIIEKKICVSLSYIGDTYMPVYIHEVYRLLSWWTWNYHIFLSTLLSFLAVLALVFVL